MGRNAGWLTAASALARIEGRKVPQLIYLCEKAFDEDRFIEDVNEALKKENNIIIAVSEGVKLLTEIRWRRNKIRKRKMYWT